MGLTNKIGLASVLGEAPEGAPALAPGPSPSRSLLVPRHFQVTRSGRSTVAMAHADHAFPVSHRSVHDLIFKRGFHKEALAGLARQGQLPSHGPTAPGVDDGNRVG